jgi:serine/threonine protein kinase
MNRKFVFGKQIPFRNSPPELASRSLNFLNQNQILNSWYFGKIARDVAGVYLSAECNVEGSYLIRERDETSFALSKKVYNSETNSYDIKHYIIKIENSLLYLNQKGSIGSIGWKSLSKLICHYRRNAELDNCTLTQPCIHPTDLTIINNLQILRSELSFNELTDVLGRGQFGVVIKGYWRGSIEVAIKKLKSDTTENREDFMKEWAILRNLHHPHLVKVFV